MSRLLCLCALALAATGCSYNLTVEDPEKLSNLSEPRSAWSWSGADRVRFNDLTVVIAGKSYRSTVRGTVKEGMDGRQLLWVDAEDNQHNLTSNEAIKYVVHSSKEVIPGDDTAAASKPYPVVTGQAGGY
jgi:hypothetical protein